MTSIIELYVFVLAPAINALGQVAGEGCAAAEYQRKHIRSRIIAAGWVGGAKRIKHPCVYNGHCRDPFQVDHQPGGILPGVIKEIPGVAG